jgi:beta-mannosidase
MVDSIPASVPGDLVSDLVRAGVIADPLVDDNMQSNESLYGRWPWRYKRLFTVDEAWRNGTGAIFLTFEGVKMGARVSLNGQLLGTFESQFARYRFNVRSLVEVRCPRVAR